MSSLQCVFSSTEVFSFILVNKQSSVFIIMYISFSIKILNAKI